MEDTLSKEVLEDLSDYAKSKKKYLENAESAYQLLCMEKELLAHKIQSLGTLLRTHAENIDIIKQDITDIEGIISDFS